MQAPFPLLREGGWRVVCLAACNAMQGGHWVLGMLVSRPPPLPAPPLPVAEAEGLAGGRAVAYMWAPAGGGPVAYMWEPAGGGL